MKSFNLTEWALSHRAVVLFLIVTISIAGALGFTRLGQLEDPKFSVPSMTAMVMAGSRCRAPQARSGRLRPRSRQPAQQHRARD